MFDLTDRASHNLLERSRTPYCLVSSLLQEGEAKRGQIIKDRIEGSIILGEETALVASLFFLVFYYSEEGDQVVTMDLLRAYRSILYESECPVFLLSSDKTGHSARRLLGRGIAKPKQLTS